MPLKAIETYYNGYRFRSRLEARWAVFFDAMSWRYRYEPEGFVLPSGLYYLPDFYLPDFNWWFEIKAKYPDPTQRKIAADFYDAGMQYCILYGDCAEDEHGAYWLPAAEYGEPPYEQPSLGSFAICRKCEQGLWFRDDDSATALLSCDASCTSERWPLTFSHMQQAYLRAKRARFEHGEHGAA